MVYIAGGRYPVGEDEPFEYLGQKIKGHMPRHEIEIARDQEHGRLDRMELVGDVIHREQGAQRVRVADRRERAILRVELGDRLRRGRPTELRRIPENDRGVTPAGRQQRAVG